MKQIVIIHGGDAFPDRDSFKAELKAWEVSLDTFLFHKDWKLNLPEDLGADFQVLNPRMPNRYNAHYDEWEIWFEKMIPFLTDGVILIGHSQGGIFLAKYLATHTFPKKIAKLILVAAPHSSSDHLGDFALPQSLVSVPAQCGEIHLFQSDDDPLVDPSEAERYLAAWPRATLHKLSGQGHIRGDHFPELIDVIK